MSKQANNKPNDFKGFDDPIAIFRVGKHTDSAGTPVEITDDDLNQMVENFGHDQVPYVVGHPKDDAPAYGWAGSVFAKDGVLYSESKNVAPEFEEAVDAGRYRNRSVSIAKNDDGQWYLRHVGFLGAAAPAVKGLAPMAFNAEESEQVFEFSSAELNEAAHSTSYAMNAAARLFRNIKNALIETLGIDQAETQIPEYEIDSFTRAANTLREVPIENQAHMYSAPTIQTVNGDPMPKEKQHGDESSAVSFTEADVLAREKAAADAATIAATEAAEKRFELKQRCASFAEKLQQDGRILPNQVADVATFMAAQGTDSVMNFSQAEGDEPATISPLDFCEKLLSGMPAQFAHMTTVVAGAETDPGERERVNFRAPAGVAIDPTGLELHEKALEFQAENPKTTYLDAVKAVS